MDGVVVKGFHHAAAGVALADRVDAKKIVIRSLLGFLSSSSTPVLDSGMIGHIQIRITLAGSGVLFKSDGLTGGGISAAANTVANPGYSISNIQFKINRFQMPSAFYETMSNNLKSGQKYTIVFDDYQVYSGPSMANSKTQQLRFTTAATSIKWVMGTFVLADKDTIGACVVSNPRSTQSLFNKFATNSAQLLCNSRYFYTTGCGLISSQWHVGSARLPAVPSSKQECFGNMLTTFNMTEDAQVGTSPHIQTIEGFIDGNFADFLPLCYTGDDEKLVSGLNTRNLPLSLVWDTVGGGNQTVIPHVFVCTDKRVHIYGSQQIEIE
ncbi:hypothetical protein T484DRAFT_1758506 [Baffinella frigidus]|nr:hypothetical protein T484DRAFT_1758506 [Cryptophyta sp. CCMP2293]